MYNHEFNDYEETDDKYYNLSDEQIIGLIRKGDESAKEYIINKYKEFVKIKARPYFIIGADKEDIIQEGMIGLFKAIRDFNGLKLAGFRSFAELCVKRQIITAIKASTRQKHIPLNSYLSLNKSVYDENEEYTYIELLTDSISNPEELFIGLEDKNYIEKQIVEELSSLELKVLSYYLKGRSYFEIAALVDKDEKSIDNALQRVKKKVTRILNQKDLTCNNKYSKIKKLD